MQIRRSFSAVALCLLGVAGGGVSTAAGQPELAPAVRGDLALVAAAVNSDFEAFRSYARYWSFAYHTALFGAAALSAAAALVLKLEGPLDVRRRNNWGATLAAVSALLVTVMTLGGFQRKWEANRLAAFEVRNLQYELQMSGAQADAVLERLQRINQLRNQVIVGIAAGTALDLPRASGSAPQDR